MKARFFFLLKCPWPALLNKLTIGLQNSLGPMTSVMNEPTSDPVARFLHEATWHGSLQPAEEILSAHPEVASASIHVAAVLGNDSTVERFIALDKNNATAAAPPYGTNALVYLCMSKYLRLDESRSPQFLRAAKALLDAGADANSGFWTTGIYPEFETALYGAAGIAHHVEMTRLLLERGADPNDGEAVYHSPETSDTAAMKLLVETGRVTAENLSIMLIRKHDWHDYEGAKWLLEHGAGPHLIPTRGRCPIHHALLRDNSLAMIALLLDHGADPRVEVDGLTAIARAAREGRRDVLELFEHRDIPLQLHGVDRLIAACARADARAARALAGREPRLATELRAMGGTLLAKFAGADNVPGVALLLDLGVDIAAPFTAGDGYFDEPQGSLAIHVAAWRGRDEVVKLLIARGSPFH